MVRFVPGSGHQDVLKDLAASVRCFEAEYLYLWGTRCDIRVDFLTARSPSYSNCVVLLVIFCSNPEHFSFPISIVPPRFCVAFLNVSTSFFNSLYFDDEIVISSSPVLLPFRATYEKLFAIICSFPTAPKVRRPVFNNFFHGKDSCKIDFI